MSRPRQRVRRSDERIFVNGINASTGRYIEEPLTPAVVAELALGERPDRDRDLEPREHAQAVLNFEFAMTDPLPDRKNLEEAGWAVVFHRDADPRIRSALKELLDWRRQGAPERYCAGDLYREYAGEKGYQPGDTWEVFRQRHRIATGEARPSQMPFYVLIVGDPEAIPYTFQYAVDIQRAVGRLCFEKIEDYKNYAHTVVQAESGALTPRASRRVTIFAPANPDDVPTRRSRAQLAAPVSAGLVEDIGDEWEIKRFEEEAANKQQLTQLLGGPETPSLLFTASHGAGLNRDDPRWPRHQGALVTQDWPGPVMWDAPLNERSHYFSVDDLDETADLRALIAIFFACYGAGTPRLNDFIHNRDIDPRERLDVSETAFVAALPQRLLSHPRGGALAVVGHVERAWETTFRELGDSEPEDPDPGGFRSLLFFLAAGYPIGFALDRANDRSAELGRNLADEILAVRQGASLTPEEASKIARLWTASMDARNFIILGDPAVRVPGLEGN